MRFRFLSMVACVAFMGLPALAETSLTPAQKIEVEGIVRDLLVKEPNIIATAIQALQAAEAEKTQAQQNALVEQYYDEIYDTKDVGVDGNPQGDVTIVEFFDYRCGYCHQIHPILKELIKTDKNVRVIYREFPILGRLSTDATRMAMAAMKQGKYLELHDAYLSASEPLSDETIKSLAVQVGVDIEKAAAENNSLEILTQLSTAMRLAAKLNLHGTPALVIGKKLYPGSMSLEELKQIIAEERAAKAKPAVAPPKAP